MSEKKLNIGCGRQTLPGWFNIDNSLSVLIAKIPFLKYFLLYVRIISRQQYEAQWSRDVTWHDASRKLPYSDNSIDKIYTSHFLEHLDEKQGERVLKECFRVLKPGSLLRIVVPDLMYHVHRYLDLVRSGAETSRAAHDDLLYNIYGAYLKSGRFGMYHRYMYDWPTLSCVLKACGFSRVERQVYRVSLDAEMALLDNRPDESLHIDAIK